jgi:hypothetical protein
MRLTGTCVLVLSVFAFAVPAYAGNGNGNGNGKDNAGATDSAPGNSASAPGQVKKDAPPAETTTTASTTTTVADQSAPAGEGVKPSNETAHDTHAEAQSNQTKQYGNGQTAGQIAMNNGASGKTVLHGPGNSQPHKAAPCAGGHEVDVHALKGRRAGSCGGGADTPDPQPTPGPGHDDKPSVVVTTAEQTPSAVTDPAPQPDATGESTGEFTGESTGESTGEAASSSSKGSQSRGVLGQTQRIGRPASLPFTGQELWLAVLLGMGLIAAGLALRQIRTAEVAVQSEHDHTDRARHAARSSRPPVGGGPGR